MRGRVVLVLLMGICTSFFFLPCASPQVEIRAINFGRVFFVNSVKWTPGVVCMCKRNSLCLSNLLTQVSPKKTFAILFAMQVFAISLVLAKCGNTCSASSDLRHGPGLVGTMNPDAPKEKLSLHNNFFPIIFPFFFYGVLPIRL